VITLLPDIENQGDSKKMTRKIQILGLAVAAVLALAAIGASAASAAQFHSEVEPTTIKASTDTAAPNQVFVTPAGTTTCTGVSGDATITTKTTETITAKEIVYSGCTTKTIFGNISVSIDFKTNECDYTFHSGGTVDIGCKAGTSGIIISGPGCTITVPGETGKNQGLSSVTYDNKESGTKRDVTMTASVKNIVGSATGSFCSAQGGFTNGQYTGNVTAQGFKDEANGAQVGIWWE
jgi:hypothetical protein